MTEGFEAELDALFQLPPAEMVEARNALAARLKKSGARDTATLVKALKRPAPAAWAINQVFFRERACLESARAEVVRVRELQATDGVDRQQLAAAVAAQRTALQAVVDAALRYCAAAGLPTGTQQERRVFATVQGWLGGNGEEAPGRMTRELEPSGFEGLGLLAAPAPLPAAASAPPPPLKAAAAAASASLPPLKAAAAAPAARREPARTPAPAPPAGPSPEELALRARQAAQARVLEKKQSVEWARERLGELQKKQGLAEQAVERAKHEVEDAEKALASCRARLLEREAELARRRNETADAARAQNAAELALTQARATLAKL